MAGMELAHAQLACSGPHPTHSSCHLHSVETHRALLHRICHELLHQSGEVRAIGELYTGELHTTRSLHSPKQQGEIALKPHIAHLYFKCFICFGCMLQVFFMDVERIKILKRRVNWANLKFLAIIKPYT
jgi:hypothetical protein